MGFRFGRSIRIAPGIRINLGKRGASISVGGRGLTTNINHQGYRTTVSLPGTGASYATQRKGWAVNRGRVSISLILGMVAFLLALYIVAR